MEDRRPGVQRALAALSARYELLGALGRGGAGEVHRARDRQTGREVAIKLLLGGGDGARLERFRREAQVTAALSHPHVVTVHEAGEVEGQPFIVYELVRGARSLREAMRGLPRVARVALVRDAARGLGAAHALGIVHRDVKVENLLVDEDGRVRVADFGLAFSQEAERLTRTGAFLGTPVTMAPEQIAGDRGLTSPATDVWALGVVLYEALTDELPFHGASLVELSARICAAAPRPPRALDATIPPALERVCLRALRARPGDRFADGEAFAQALERALTGTGQRRVLPLVTAVVFAVAALLAALRPRDDEPVVTPPPPPPVTTTTSGRVEPAPRPDPPAATVAPLTTTADVRALRAHVGDDIVALGLLEAVEAGEPNAMHMLGDSVLKGSTGFPRDRDMAVRWFERAAALGSAEAMGKLGMLHLEAGRGEEARRCYLSAAERGSAWAMRKMGDLLSYGIGGPVDLPAAVDWYRRDAERSRRGYSMDRLAALLREGGEGLPADPAAAEAWAQRRRRDARDAPDEE